MKVTKISLLLFLIVLCSCSPGILTYNEKSSNEDSLRISEGLVCTAATRIKYKSKGKTKAIINLTEPIKVAQAKQEEPWGYFQFPSIGRSIDGSLIVSWRMIEDSHKSYGKAPMIPPSTMKSVDNGKTWVPQDKKSFTYFRDYHFCLNDGSILEVNTPPALDVNRFPKRPQAIDSINNTRYYIMDELSAEAKQIEFIYRGRDRKGSKFLATIEDPGALRYAIDNLMPILWIGNIKQLENKSLIAGVYPNYYLDKNEKVMPCGVSFFKSTDFGHSWKVLSKIPFPPDGIGEVRGDNGFFEPAFEVLSDSSFICVMRTGMVSPMYKTFSFDRGKNWTTPEPFTPNGVKPRLMKLKNGVLVLVSGRPGIQLRFSFDGTGRLWSDPIDMIPFMNEDGSFTQDVSCGYASILEADDNSFYLVYSDFTTHDMFGNIRKSIWFREIKVTLPSN